MSDYIKRIEIKCWRTGRVLFEHEAENNTMCRAIEDAVKAGANLTGANLAGVNLAWADLPGAKLAGSNLTDAHLDDVNLAGANLSGAYLVGTYLGGVNLAGASLAWADLAGAQLDDVNLAGVNLTGVNLTSVNLTGVNLDGAYLVGTDGEKITLVGSCPVLQIGPISREWGTLIAYLTDRGVYLSLGSFFGTREQFAARFAARHHDNAHAEVYRAALALIEAHERLWMPADEASEAARATGQEG